MGEQPTTPPPRPNKPILVVDDDARLRRALCRILRAEGHTVIEAGDGESALDLARAYELGLVVLDYAMPGLDGASVLETMRRWSKAVPPTVLMTAGDHQQARADALGAGRLAKPFRVEALLEAVRARAVRP